MKNLIVSLIAIFSSVCCLAQERRYYDAYLLGLFYGNPAKVVQTQKSADKTKTLISTFSDDGAMISFNNSTVKNTVRDGKGRLISFELSDVQGDYYVVWNDYGIGGFSPAAFKERSPFTRAFSNDFMDVGVDYGHEARKSNLYVSSKKYKATLKDETGKKTDNTLMVVYYRHPVFDAYGNVVRAVMEYSSNGVKGDDIVYSANIEYRKDRSDKIPATASFFSEVLKNPGGFAYNPDNKRNLYQQMYMDYCPSNLTYKSNNLRGRYTADRKDTYGGIPFDFYLYSTVRGETDEIDTYWEFHGSRHEVNGLYSRIIRDLEKEGFVFNAVNLDYKTTTYAETKSSSKIVVHPGKKKRLEIQSISLSTARENGIDRGSLRINVRYREIKN